MKKILLYLSLALVLVLGIWIYWRYYYVFGDGVKTGQLNFVVRKGDLFKTYEGKLIQSGFKSKTVGTVQSYEFEFSVENKELAEYLMKNSGKDFDLHYKEYHNRLPWRGNTNYIVDSILAVR